MQKRAKIDFQFQNSYKKKAKMKKKKAHFFGIFLLLTFFCIFYLKIHAKRKKYMQKKFENSISKKHAKKRVQKMHKGCNFHTRPFKNGRKVP